MSTNDSKDNKEFVTFESINKDRANDIASRYVDRQYAVTRAEIILTNRCQLKCAYCQLQLEQSCNEVRVEHEVMLRTLEQYLNAGCRFLHFTGGEATLCEHLPEYVEMASKTGAEVTLSTNGVNSLELYDRLVRSGVNCFHISLDTVDSEVFDKQVGVEGSFEKVIQTIHLITRLRDEEHYRTRLVLNVCITPKTFDNLINIVRFMISLKPNDIKLIPISQLKNQWGQYEEKYEAEIKPSLLAMIPDTKGFNMFKSRVNSLVKTNFRGYNNKRVVPPCYLSQDERTIDPEGNYYGCYINYREGAAPIGNILEDSYIEQSEKLRKHMLQLTTSDICQKYCADITVMCNKYIDTKVREMDCSKFICMGNVNTNRMDYGNKAYNLERMYEEGLNVPKACYIKSEFLNRIFLEEHQEEYEALEHTKNEFDRKKAIAEWIMGQETNAELVEVCEEIMKELKSELYAVRSSSSAEDSDHESFAGVFDSYLNILELDGMVEAVRKVYASKYNYLVGHPEEVEMGVIIQEQIQADVAGVTFTSNPITGEDELVIDYVAGCCESVVNGDDAIEVVLKGQDRKIGDLPKAASEDLLDQIDKIHAMFGEKLDIEWAIQGNKAFILQARPITSVKKRVRNECIYVDSMDVDKLNLYDMSSIMKSHRNYMEKHYNLRKYAKDAGIAFPKVGYLFYDKEMLSEEKMDELIPKARIYKVVTDQEKRTLAKEELFPYLMKFGMEKNQIVRIQEITLTNACGNVGFTKNGNIYVEYIPGGFGGFLTGELPFSYYVLSSEGDIVEKEEKEYSSKWVFNDVSKKFLRTNINKEKYCLSDSVLTQLVHIIQVMGKKIQNACVEWEMEGDKVYINDVSFDNETLEDNALSKRQLSSGTIMGEIRVIDKQEELKDILKTRSITAEKEFYLAERSEKLKAFLEKYKIEEDKKYVFVCESAHPSISLLMKWSSGFVFERGGQLSHMAIILREKHIPAVVEEGAMTKYRNGEEYEEV